MNPALILQLVSIFAKNSDAIGKILPVVLPIVSEVVGKIGRPQSQAPTYDVRWLQQSLNTLNGAGLELDGSYGDKTRGAVRQFQEKFMPTEPADGWAGVKTTAAIINALEKRR